MKLKLFLFLSLYCSCFSLSSQEALDRLLEGNKRYAEEHPLHADTSATRREATVAKQNPFAVILGCSDSRVPPETLFDQGIGDLFVIRVAGNVAGPLELDSMEYAVSKLGCSVVLVLGHENCGAVKAAMQDDLQAIQQIGGLIKPALQGCSNWQGCIESNVRYVVTQIKSSPLLTPHLDKGEIEVVGAYYDLNTGKITLLN